MLREHIGSPPNHDFLDTFSFPGACAGLHCQLQDALRHLRHVSTRCSTNVSHQIFHCYIDLVPFSTGAPNMTILSLLQCSLTVTGSLTRDHSFLLSVPVLRNMCHIYNMAWYYLTVSTATKEYVADDLFDENPRRHRILRTLYRLY